MLKAACLNELLRSYLIKKRDCLLCGDVDNADIFDCGISAIRSCIELLNATESKTYVAVATCGYGDDHYSEILYVGHDRVEAIVRIRSHTFPSEYNNYGHVEVWDNGNRIKYEDVID